MLSGGYDPIKSIKVSLVSTPCRHPADPQALRHRRHWPWLGHRHRHRADALHCGLVHPLLGGGDHALHGAALLPLSRSADGNFLTGSYKLYAVFHKVFH